MLPAGSLNQAMSGPAPRAMPFSSCSKPSYRSKRTPARGQLVDGRVDVVDREVQDRVGRRREVRLRVDQRVAVTGEVQHHQAVLRVEHGRLKPERLAVELAACSTSSTAKPLNALRARKHDHLLFEVQVVDRATIQKSSNGSLSIREQRHRQTRVAAEQDGPGDGGRSRTGRAPRRARRRARRRCDGRTAVRAGRRGRRRGWRPRCRRA